MKLFVWKINIGFRDGIVCAFANNIAEARGMIFNTLQANEHFSEIMQEIGKKEPEIYNEPHCLIAISK
jgi:hypothetical protein